MNLNLSLLFPEWMAAGFLILLLVTELFKSPESARGKSIHPIWIAAAFFVFLAVLPYSGKIGAAFGGMFILDPLASFFKAFFAFVFFVIVWMTRDYFENSKEKPGEFLLILWSILVGLFFLVSANDLLVIFVSLEIVTLSFYVLAAYLKRELVAIEAGLKYLILGSLASAFMIFGIALIYVALGTTALPEIRIGFAAQPDSKLMLLGILFILSGLGFKIASVPFQLWVPDVYQGAPTPTVAFLAVGSKAAGIAVILRLFFTTFITFQSQRHFLFAILAAMTLLYGNLGALHQTNIKRLFGYSSIGHAGYLLFGIAAGGESGISAVFYYLIAYGITNLTAFFVILQVGKHTGSDEITAYSGLAKRSPLLAGAFFVALLSLAGIPPLAGFFGKFLLLFAAVESDLAWLALLGALTVVISLYYYLNVVRVMYVEEAAHEEPIRLKTSSACLLILLVIGIFVVGIWQAPFLEFATQASLALT